MRSAWLPVTGLMASLVLVASGGGASFAAESSRSVVTARPAGLTVAVVDAQCPKHRGIGINTAEWRSRAVNELKDWPGLAAAMLSNGDVLVVASGAPKPGTAIAAEFRGPCTLDPRFGHNGVTELAMKGPGVSISTIHPMAGGGAILAGSTGQPNIFKEQWLVGKLTAHGRLEPTFGDRGWRVLPWHGDVSDVAVTRDGAILMGGEDRPRENGQSMLAEVTAHGKLLTLFGTGGRVGLPEYHDGGVGGIWVEPTGDVLALLGGGNMGCWGVTALTFTPSGHRVPGFTGRFLAAVEHFDPSSECPTPVFVGDIDAGPTGFHLIGTSQPTCVNSGCTEHPTSKPDPGRAVRDIAFKDNGDLDASFGADGATDFRAPMADGAWALSQTGGRTLLVTSPAGNLYRKTRAFLLVYGIARTGHLDTRYAKHGVARIPLPYKTNDFNLPLYGGSALPVSNGRQTAVVANRSPGNSVILIRVPKY